MGYGLDDRGFESLQGLGIFLFTTASRPALGPTQPPMKRILESLSLGLKQPFREADHSPPSTTEDKVLGAIIPLPSTPSWRGTQLKKAQVQLYLHLTHINIV